MIAFLDDAERCASGNGFKGEIIDVLKEHALLHDATRGKIQRDKIMLVMEKIRTKKFMLETRINNNTMKQNLVQEIKNIR